MHLSNLFLTIPGYLFNFSKKSSTKESTPIIASIPGLSAEGLIINNINLLTNNSGIQKVANMQAKSIEICKYRAAVDGGS